jgi:sugar phosphate isomerase/epimerase
MGAERNLITVFSKPWPTKTTEELASFVRDLGLDGVELPVRPGFQVEPAQVRRDLPKAARIFEERGVKIRSIAGSADKSMVAACGEAGIPIVRIMASIDMKKGYQASVAEHRRTFDALLPDLEKHRVTIGVQNHCDHFVGSAVGLIHLLGSYDKRLVGAVLDPAHCGLDGESEDMAVDIVWPSLVLVNLKNAYWQMFGGAAPEPQWRTYWCGAKFGLCSWPVVLAELRKRGWAGDYCLTAEYSNPEGAGDLTGDTVVPLLREDIRYLKGLLAEQAKG